jgi:hypothetical protein
MDWNLLLSSAGKLVLEAPAFEYLREDLPAAARTPEGLARPGAGPEQIATLEARLGVALPPSYREFLASSNGFTVFPGFDELLASDQVDWFRVLNEDWCEILEETCGDWTKDRSNIYPNYDWPSPYARHLLQVNRTLDGNTVLLNPQVVSQDGEWEAYSLFSHGSVCHRSFADLVAAQLQHEEEYARKHPEDPLAPLKPLLELTRLARGGRTAEVKAKIEVLYSNGMETAAAPLAEIAAFEGEWHATATYALEAMARNPDYARDLRLPALCALTGVYMGSWSAADAALEFLSKPSDAVSEIYTSRVAELRSAILERRWPKLSWRVNFPTLADGDYPTRVSAWASFCEKNRKEYPRNWKTPELDAHSRFIWAIFYRLPDEAMQIARERPNQWLDDPGFEMAYAYAEMGRSDDAWGAILHALRFWQDGDQLWRIAPVELLIIPPYLQS